MRKLFWRKYCLIEVLCPDLRQLLQQLSAAGIEILDLEQMDMLRFRMKLNRKDMERAQVIVRKTGGTQTVMARNSSAQLIQYLVRRPVLVLGILFFLLLTLALPRRILFVQVQGNRKLTQAQILDAAAESGLGFGVSRRDLRSEEIKNKMLQALPELQWVGVNTRGSVALIQVRERSGEESSEEVTGIGHVVALRDGIITDCTATKGNLLCSPGQAVTEGQILISGLTDCGLVIRAEQARGEVYAMTRHQTELILPLQYSVKSPEGGFQYRISVLIGKKRIKIWKNSGISSPICDRMYKEYYVTLPGGFRLPAVLIVERFQPCSYETTYLPEADAMIILEDISERYVRAAMNSGSILSSDAKLWEHSGSFGLTGEYHCIEMIGKMQRLQIGEQHE